MTVVTVQPPGHGRVKVVAVVMVYVDWLTVIVVGPGQYVVYWVWTRVVVFGGCVSMIVVGCPCTGTVMFWYTVVG